MENRRVLVTGSAGVIGRELVRMLLDRGAHVLSVDREPLPADLAPRVEHLRQDLALGGEREMRDFDPEVVLHLAASFERSHESPDFWPVNWRDNVVASHNVVSAAADAPSLRTFVFASSYLIYATEQYMFSSPPERPALLSEGMRMETRNLCGAAKYYTEQELRFLGGVGRPSVRTASARIFRVYGLGSKDVVSRWIRALLAGDPIDVYNRRNRFDYVFARDVAEGLLRIAGSERVEGPVNLGSGRSRSVGEVLEILGSVLPEAADLQRDLGSPDPFEASCADLTRLQELTGWSPGTSLEKGIREVVAHEREEARRTLQPLS